MSPIAKFAANVVFAFAVVLVPHVASAQAPSDHLFTPTIRFAATTYDAGSWASPRTEPRPSRGSVLPVLYVTLAGLNTLDAYTTMRSLSAGAVEANPLMKGVADHGGALFAVKTSASVLSIYAAERLWRKNKKVHAIAALVGINALMAVAVNHNTRLHQGLR